jgi:hypothetical protein
MLVSFVFAPRPTARLFAPLPPTMVRIWRVALETPAHRCHPGLRARVQLKPG